MNHGLLDSCLIAWQCNAIVTMAAFDHLPSIATIQLSIISVFCLSAEVN